MAEDLSKRLYVKNVDEWQAELSKKRFSDRELEVKVVERGIVLPGRGINGGTWKYEGGVCDKDFNFVAGFTRRDPCKEWSEHSIFSMFYFASVESSYTVERKNIIQLDEDVIFGGSLIGHVGNFIGECLSNLWYVLQNPQLQYKILFIMTYPGYASWFNGFFTLMGIAKERIIYVKQPTQCRSVIIPEQSQYRPVTYTKEFLFPYQAIKSNVKPGNHKKLYLTRTAVEEVKTTGGVRCFNEKYFEDFFFARGFEIIYMEKLPIEEQVSLIMGADEIAASLGTLTHWAMFCKPSAKYIMLNRTNDSVLELQCFINKVFNINNYYVVDASRNFMYADRTHGAIMHGSNTYWKEFVADYFGEQIDEDDDNLYFADSLDKYVDFWYKKYSGSKDICRNSLKDMCNRIIKLEKEVSAKRPVLSYQTHVAQKGWVSWTVENQLSNPLDQYDIQAIKIEFTEPFHDVYYAVYYNEAEGWSQEVSTSKMAGTTGQGKPITGIKIRLDEAGASKFDILYRVHKFDGDWTPWAKNGEEIIVEGVKLNSLQIKLEPAAERPLTDKHESWRAWIAKN